MIKRSIGLAFIALIMLVCIVGCASGTNEPLGNNRDTTTKADLIGYWHYTSDYTKGMGMVYEFKSDGDYFYSSGDNYSHGRWDIQKGSNILTLIENGSDHENSYGIEYVVVDEATISPSIKIDNQKFWKKDLFQDIVDGSPVYINLDSNLENKEYQNKTAISKTGPLVPPLPHPGAEYNNNVIVYSDSDLYNFKISSIGYGSDNNYYYLNVIFSLDMLPSDYYMEYVTQLPEIFLWEAVSFTDSKGEDHTHIIKGDNYDGSTCSSSRIPVLDMVQKPLDVTITTPPY